MSFRGLFKSKPKHKSEKNKKLKSSPAPQQVYEAGKTYLQILGEIPQIRSAIEINKAVIELLKKIFTDEMAKDYQEAIRSEFKGACVEENIEYLVNYIHLNAKIQKQAWQAFYHQYVEEDKDNTFIKFTGINIDDAERKQFATLNSKIQDGENDLNCIMVDANQSISAKAFLDSIAQLIAGYVWSHESLIEKAIKSTMPSKERDEEKELKEDKTKGLK